MPVFSSFAAKYESVLGILALLLAGPVVAIGQSSDSLSGDIPPVRMLGMENALRTELQVKSLSILPLRRRAASDDADVIGARRKYRPRRLWWGVGGAVVLNAGAIAFLHKIWYGSAGTTSWHWYDKPGGRGWYDDWFNYVQQDKLGHLYNSWELTRLAAAYGQWSGLSRRNAALLGAGATTFFMAQIELFDGFSEIYGASRTDLLANATGSVLAGVQHLYPDGTDWFTFKYAYHPSPYYEPDKSLGNLITDYQGFTFWLSLRPERMLPFRAQSIWPDWLALSVGHSGIGLDHPFSGRGNTPEHRRQLLIGPDVIVGELVDLPRSMQALEHLLSIIRLPLPAFQIAPRARWHFVYF